MGDIEDYVTTLQIVNAIRRSEIAKNGKARKRKNQEEYTLYDKETNIELRHLPYRFRKMQNITEYFEKNITYEKFLEDPNMYLQNIYHCLAHTYSWLAFVTEHVALDEAILNYHNEELVLSVAQRNDLAKFDKEIKEFKKHYKEIVSKIRTQKPLTDEDRKLITWWRKATDDSKIEDVI